MIMYVYKITNKINGKIYIGKTKTPGSRFKKHISVAKQGKSNRNFFYLHAAIAKYGCEFFVFEIIEKCSSEDEAYDRESFWIKSYSSNDKNKGYNLNEGGLRGGIRKGEIRSLTRIFKNLFRLFSMVPNYSKIYRSKKQILLDAQRSDVLAKYKIPVISDRLTDEIKSFVIQLKNTGIFFNYHIAFVLNLPVKTIRYIWNRYKKGIPSAVDKSTNRSKAMTGKKHSDEWKKMMSEMMKGKHLSENSKKKISVANSGSNNGMAKGHSIKTKEKMKIAQRKRRERELHTIILP
jgi:group I intron endonuclease